MIAEVLSRTTFIKSPEDGVGIRAAAFYCAPEDGKLISIHAHWSAGDVEDVCYFRRSDDNGLAWIDGEIWETTIETPEGTLNRHARGIYYDSGSKKTLFLWQEGFYNTEEVLMAMTSLRIHYAISEDGGMTFPTQAQMIHEGKEYDDAHPLPGVTIGKNCYMLGDLGMRPITLGDGKILVPIQSSPTGPDGKYSNPGGGYTYTDAMVMIGSWQPDGTLSWVASERVKADPERSTRGMIEPTLAELADGRILMLMRGSNGGTKDPECKLPGYRWYSISSDCGMTWSSPEPWTYTDGNVFFSPSACSQLIPHNGHLLWLGNLCEQNPRENGPRYPLVLGEVDVRTGLLIKDSVTIIDNRGEDECEHLTLSNMFGRVERETGDVLVYLARFFSKHQLRDENDWSSIDFSADGMCHRIAVDFS